MKRSQSEASASPPSKRQNITKLISQADIGPVSTEDEMNLKVLMFQNQKLAERLEDMKADEEKMREQLAELKQQRESDLTILSLINRHWIQLDEDVKTLLQRYKAETEDNTDVNEASSLSYLDHIASLETEQARAEVTQRATASKQHVEKLLQYVEKSGTHVTVPSTEVEKSDVKVTDEAEELQKEEGKAGVDASASSLNLPDLEADNKQLRGLLTSIQQKQQMTSLEFYDLRDKYAVAQKEISELNNKLQDAEYELQKSTHRVDNLVKRMNEMEEARKKVPEGNVAGEPSTSTSSGNEEMDEEVEKHKELARTRLEELEKLHDSYTQSQQEVDKLKLEVAQVPESVITESAPYKCLQSQFSVLFNESTQLRQQLEDIRRVLSNSKTQHTLQLEQFESETLSTEKRYRAEVNELHDALLQVKKDYDLLRMEFEQNLKSNEQTGPMAKEMSLMISSLQNHNQQLKVEAMRYKQKFNDVQAQHTSLTEEDDRRKKPDEKEQVTDEAAKEEKKSEEHEGEASSSKEGGEQKQLEEEGEIEEGEAVSSPRPTNKDSEVIKELRMSLKKSEESQKEMKLLLDMYKGASKDLRDKVELLAVEKRLKAEIESLKAKEEETQKELEKHKGSLADEEAVRRLKMAEETIEQLQKNLAGTKQAEDALLAEMEFTGQAFEEMQEQNVRIIQQLREKDEANLKLMSERIKANQIQKQLREEKDALADQVTSLNTLRETQTQVLKKLDERERVMQNAMTSMDKELNLRQQAMELHKRKAIESAQAAQDLKIKFDALQQQMQEVQEIISEKTRSLEEEAYKARRVQEECSSLKRKLEKQKKIDLYGAADEVLLEEIKQYKAKLTCPCCNMRKKDAILTKCFHVFCFDCLKTRYDTRQRKCPKCNALFGTNDFHKIYL